MTNIISNPEDFEPNEIPTEDIIDTILDICDEHECNLKITYSGIYKNFAITFEPENRKRFGNQDREKYKLKVFQPTLAVALDEILQQIDNKIYPQGRTPNRPK